MNLAAIEYGAEGWKDFQNNDVNRCKTGYLTDVFPKTGLVLDDAPMRLVGEGLVWCSETIVVGPSSVGFPHGRKREKEVLVSPLC